MQVHSYILHTVHILIISAVYYRLIYNRKVLRVAKGLEPACGGVLAGFLSGIQLRVGQSEI